MTARRALLVVAAAALAFPYVLNGAYALHIAILTMMNVVLASSLGLIVRTGQISFAHPAFMAIGAYGCTLMVDAGMSWWVAFALAVVLSGIVALLVGLPVLRIKGAYFFLVTFALLECIRLVVSYFRKPFGGSRGIIRIAAPTLTMPGLPTIDFARVPVAYYYLMLIICAVSLFVVFRIERTRYGRLFKAIAENDALAESLGVDLMKHKMLAFAVGCMIAAAAGAFYAPYFTFINPDSFSLSLAIFTIVYIIVGGTGKLAGSIVGAVVLTLLPEALSATSHYKMMVFSVCLILVVLFVPGGLVTIPARIQALMARKA